MPPEAQPEAQPGGQPGGQPGDQPGDQPGGQPGGQPDGQPNGRPEERQTFFADGQAHDSSLLTIGSMVYDYEDPTKRHPPGPGYYRHKFDCAVEDSPLVTVMHRPSFNIHVALTSKDGHRIDSLRADISGENGSKIELKQPEQFFKEHVLTNDKAQEWLQEYLVTDTKVGAMVKNATRKPPKIWLLVGVFVARDAKMSSEQHCTENRQVIRSLLCCAIRASTWKESHNYSSAGAKLGNRIYAARWQRVSAKYMHRKSMTDMDSKRVQLELLEEFSEGNYSP